MKGGLGPLHKISGACPTPACTSAAVSYLATSPPPGATTALPPSLVSLRHLLRTAPCTPLLLLWGLGCACSGGGGAGGGGGARQKPGRLFGTANRGPVPKMAKNRDDRWGGGGQQWVP